MTSPVFTVLIIDDIPQNIQVAATTLRSSGYNVSFATSGAEGIERAQAITPDVILLDVMMPGMNGYETCTHLKSDPRTADIPVVFLTALDDKESIVRGFDHGGVDFINKPFNPPELLARVGTHAQMSYYQRLLAEKNDMLENINATLEEQVALRTSDLELSLRKEKRFNEMTNSLIAMIGHEFRTPMTVLHSAAEILNYAENLPAEKAQPSRKKMTAQIAESVKVMAHHLDSISEMMRTQTDLLHEHPVELMVNAFVKECIQEFARKHQPQQHIDLVLPETEVVGFVMPDNLHLALEQLLHNAMQYSPSDSTITVRMQYRHNALSLSVEDQGKGISSDDAESVYTWFRRGEGETQLSHTRGLGIGLAVTQLCTDTMHGDLRHEALDPVGTRFVLTLPVHSLTATGDFNTVRSEMAFMKYNAQNPA
ncbi:MAG: hybrid sensor histidine kinase/response regulator [Candidatus Kapabacteria bacterium]|nr:hybrid sensor histidine kinase/response regulator [Candidatus Kapabacteria bacterium]